MIVLSPGNDAPDQRMTFLSSRLHILAIPQSYVGILEDDIESAGSSIQCDNVYSDDFDVDGREESETRPVESAFDAYHTHPSVLLTGQMPPEKPKTPQVNLDEEEESATSILNHLIAAHANENGSNNSIAESVSSAPSSPATTTSISRKSLKEQVLKRVNSRHSSQTSLPLTKPLEPENVSTTLFHDAADTSKQNGADERPITPSPVFAKMTTPDHKENPTATPKRYTPLNDERPISPARSVSSRQNLSRSLSSSRNSLPPAERPITPSKEPLEVREVNYLNTLLESEQKRVSELSEQLTEVKQQCTSLTDENRILNAEVVDLRSQLVSLRSSARHDKSNGPIISEQERDKILQDLKDQEVLIHGFQVENEKLLTQVRSLHAQQRETEEESLRKQQELVRQVEALKTRVSELEGREKQAARQAAEQTRREMEEKVKEAEAKEVLWKNELDKFKERVDDDFTKDLEDKLKQAEAKAVDVEKHASAKEQEADVLKSKNEEFKAKLDAIEQKLQEKNQKVVELEKKLFGANKSVEHLQEQIKKQQNGQQSIPPSLNQTKNIREYQKRVEELESENAKLKETMKKKSTSSIPVLSKGSRTNMSSASVVDKNAENLKEKNQELEAKLSLISSERERVIEDYETAIRKLEQELSETRQKVMDLQQVNDAISSRQSTPTESGPEKSRDKEILHLRASLSKLRQKHDSVVDQWNTASMALKIAESKITDLTRELAEVRTKCSQDDQIRSELSALKQSYEKAQRLNEELEHKLETNDAVRQAMHDNFLTILRQSQEETTRAALQHQERALKLLREESRVQTSQLLSEEIKRWRDQIADYETQVSFWKAKAADLEDSMRMSSQQNDDKENARSELNAPLALVEENARLKAELRSLLETSDPEMVPLQHMIHKIQQVENRLSKREQEFQRLLQTRESEAHKQVEQVKKRYERALQVKSDEIKRFQREVDELVRCVETLKQAM